MAGLLLLTMWCCACTLGFLQANAYTATPGQSQIAPPRFPQSSQLTLAPSQSTLVLFLHPRCACSQATLDQLEELLGSLGASRPRVEAMMFVPMVASDEWTQGKLWDRIRTLADRVQMDPNGREGHRFGAYTSGHCALYGADGRLLYSGGLTDSRGHAGPSTGVAAMRALLSGQPSAQRFASTFGCQISQEDKRDPICR